MPNHNSSLGSFDSGRPRRPRRAVAALFLILAVAAPRLVTAQFQVNPMVNTGVNRQIYGAGGPTGCINFAGTPGGIQAKSSQMMGSEFKYAAWSSGASRSDIRMNYAALGPRAQGGASSYINYTPSYMNKGGGAGTGYVPPPAGSSAYSTGSMRYSSAKPVTSFARPTSTSMGISHRQVGPASSGSMSVPSTASSKQSIRYNP
jgi:hypothetical protein